MVDETIDQNNDLMILERFLGVAHRNVDTFIAINDALTLLQRAVGEEICECCIPVNYTFLRNQFSRLASFIPGNDDVVNIIRNLCVSLERTNDQHPTRGVERRESICDPSRLKTMGRFTHKTSSRVDDPKPTNRTDMIDKFRVQHLKRVH